MRLARGKDFAERGHETRLGRIVGPEGKDTTRVELGREDTQAFGAVELPVALVKKIGR